MVSLLPESRMQRVVFTPIFARIHVRVPNFPRSAGQKGFEPSPITSTRCQNYIVLADGGGLLMSDRSDTFVSLFKPSC